MYIAMTGHSYPNQKVLYLSSVEHLGMERFPNVKMFSGETAEDAQKIIELAGAEEVMFSLYGMPRRAVPVDHPKMGAYLRKWAKTWAGREIKLKNPYNIQNTTHVGTVVAEDR